MDLRLHPTIGHGDGHDPAGGGSGRPDSIPPTRPIDEPHRASDAEASDDLSAMLRSTPAKLVTLGALVGILLLVSGIVAAQMVSSRKATHDHLLGTIEPVANSAQDLYSALSVADAAAVTGFISGGIEPEAVRDRYEQSIGEASAQLVAAAGGTDDDADSTRLLSGLAGQLTVYTGLIETARANNRVGNPVGAAYLSEASNLMQTSMLPIAQELHTRGVAAVESTQHAAVRPPWAAIGLLLAAVAALCAVHLVISRISRRALNPGLILAIGATGVLLMWMLVAGLVSSSATQRAITHGAEPLAVLTESRILAQQSRTAETLLLARRDSTGEYDSAFDESMTRLGDRLHGYTADSDDRAVSSAVAQALSARTAWIESHERTHAALARGDYTAAATLVTGPGVDESTAQFTTVDRALTDGITAARGELRANEARAAQLLSALSTASIALMGVALLGVAIGSWPRLREYR